jgi:NAD(P)-dependent dehydrogenase (short-subunit alcohol dehydrogenase family)
MTQYWLVTGGNRGIGLALVQQLAVRKDFVLFVSVRNTSKLGELAKVTAKHSNVHIIQLRLEVVADAKKAAAEIAKVTDHLDVVIANAGIAYNWERLEQVDPEVIREHFTVNSLGTFTLFQAVLPLLRKAGTSKFVPITTEIAAMTLNFPYPVTAVGISKVATNYITKRIHAEHASEGIIAFPLNPGGVKTDIGALAAPQAFGIAEFGIEPEDCAKGIISLVDNATAATGGHFWQWDGKELPW